MIYILSEKPYEGAENLPCILTKYHTVSLDLSVYDALIFSSKNGVHAIDQINQSWKNIPAYSIGEGTSKAINTLGGKLVYAAKRSYGDDFSHEIKTMLQGKKVLFLRAKVVTSSLNSILKDAGVMLEEEIVYETVCNTCDTLPKPESGSIIIFSSPSTIECFFRCFTWDESYKAVVIGDVTASYMPKNIAFTQAPQQTIPSCIELALTLK